MGYEGFLERNRAGRSKRFELLGKFLLKLGIKANYLTFLSLVCGVLGVFFLFLNYWMFILFILLHLLFDALDGVVARLSGATGFGKYFDYFNDQFIVILLLGKIFLELKDYYVVLVICLFVLGQIVYVLSRFKYPAIFFRTGIVIALLFYPWFSSDFIPIGVYLASGIVSVYTLVLQFRWFLGNFKG